MKLFIIRYVSYMYCLESNPRLAFSFLLNTDIFFFFFKEHSYCTVSLLSGIRSVMLFSLEQSLSREHLFQLIVLRVTLINRGQHTTLTDTVINSTILH